MAFTRETPAVNSRSTVSSRVVHVEPPRALHERDLEMLGGIDPRVEIDRGAMAGPRVVEIDLLADAAVHTDLRQAPRRAELGDEPELLAADRLVSGADPVVDVAELHEAVHRRIHAGARLDLAADEDAVAIRLMVEVDERAHAGEKPFGMDAPSAAAGDLSVPHLRHEPVVRAEPVRDVAIFGVGVKMRRAVSPLHIGRMPAQALTVPFVREIRPVRGECRAVDVLARHEVGA